MQNQNVTTTEKRYTITNGVPNAGANASATLKSFTFTGFGNGNFVDPVAGTYSKNHVSYLQGRTRTTVLKPPGNDTLVTGPQSGPGSGSHAPEMPVAQVDENRLYNDALEKLYDKMHDKRTDVSVGVGESAQTKRMVTKAVQSAGKVILAARTVVRSVKRGDAIQDLSKAWLAYQYGWKPLLSDIWELAHFSTRHFDEFTFVGSSYQKMSLSGSGPVDSTRYFITEAFGGKGVARCRYSVTARVNDPEAFNLGRITSMNPVGIAWELMPWSFVVDWVYDIGGYLALQEAAMAAGLSFVRGHRTITYSFDSWRTVVGAGIYGAGTPVNPQRLQMADLSSRRRRASKSRTKLLSFPRPLKPTLKVNLGAYRILSAGALLATTLGRKPR